MGAEHKGDLLTWYQANKITADRIVNDLNKQSYEAVMHMYAYAAKSLKLEYVVSQQDFPTLFSNNYTRVGDTLMGTIAFLLNEGNINFAHFDKVRNTLRYWLACGSLYETLVSKIMVRAEHVHERLQSNAFTDLQQQLVDTSIQNGIKSQEDWNRFFGLIPKPESEQKEGWLYKGSSAGASNRDGPSDTCPGHIAGVVRPGLPLATDQDTAGLLCRLCQRIP